jgi:5'-phosphate synthase pdxT subunit
VDGRPTIGVLALQGGVAPHLAALARLDAAERSRGLPGVEARTVKTAEELAGLDAVILPGGESSAVGKLLADSGLLEALRAAGEAGMPLWGTCMGAILLARDIENDGRRHLGLMGLRVRRNAYGGQLDSFVSRGVVEVSALAPSPAAEALASSPFPMVFIRAPVIADVDPDVAVLAREDGTVAACAQGSLLATTFHPELTEDIRFHALFVEMARGRPPVQLLRGSVGMSTAMEAPFVSAGGR